MATAPITSLCNDTAEAVSLNAEMSLFLKPISKLHISVQLPQMKSTGKAISNWEVMEKLKVMAKPEKFVVLKVIKSALEFIRLEGELESRAPLSKLLAKLDGTTMKLSGYPETLKVRAVEAKPSCPTRHHWDSYFRDAKHMNEMKPGERPDTVYLSDLPCKWFSDQKSSSSESTLVVKPSEQRVNDVFSQFGTIRVMDIPLLDPYREEIAVPLGGQSTIQQFKFGQELQFDVYIQYKEYMCFVKCMEALRGMKLMHIDKEGKAFTANIKVDFDTTKHLSDRSIKKRELEQRKIKALLLERERKKQAEEEYEERRRRETARRKQEEQEERERRKREREDKRREKILEARRMQEEKEMAHNIAVEERKILIAQRKLESIRLLSELLERVKKQKTEEEVIMKEKELVEEQQRLAKEKLRQEELAKKRKLEEKKKKEEENQQKEKDLRERILRSMKEKQDKKLESEREALRRRIAGHVRLKSTIVRNKWLGKPQP